MTTFSRKKIRGFDRKLRQLDDWKKIILAFPTNGYTKPSGQIFRIHLKPFHWYGEKNPNLKFHRHLYKVYADILQNLKNNEVIVQNNLRVQLWLFFPRTVRSLIIVAPYEHYEKRIKQIGAREVNISPPRLFGDYFKEFKLMLGEDIAFEAIDNNYENPKWLTRTQGNIWTVE